MLPRHLARKRDEMPDTVSPVIVGVDGTYTPIRAARRAAAMAQQEESALAILQSADRRLTPPDEASFSGAAPR